MIKRTVKSVYYTIKNSGKNIKLNSNVNIGGFSTKFEGCNVIGKNSFFSGSLGFGSYIGNNCSITAEIGRYCSIASDVTFILGKHPTREFVSTHPAFFSTKRQAGFTYVNEDIFSEDSLICKVGNDVWIGSGAKILPGVKIGDGAIIAAGAVVTKDVEPYSIVGGTPAKEIRKRFTDDEIEFLVELKWWDKPQEWIRENASKFNNIKQLMK